MCIQTGPVGLPQVTALAKRFPNVPIILDHLGRPDVTDGPPYASAQSLFDLADAAEHLPEADAADHGRQREGGGHAETFFPKLVEVFGAKRLAWGSNFPTSPGTLSEILATARERLASCRRRSRWVFGKTALSLYPKLGA
jgi:L-fuconolactonase